MIIIWKRAALRRAFAEAAGSGRAGALREVMTTQYTRLAQLTEDLIARLVQDTEVPSTDSSPQLPNPFSSC